MSHPFLPDCHAPDAPTAAEVHRALLDALSVAADSAGDRSCEASGPGRSIRLTSPRAGSGQTHLLARLHALAPGRWTWVSLGAGEDGEDPPASWAELTRHLVRALLTEAPDSGAPSVMDEVAWFASYRLVRAGLENGTIRTGNVEESRRRLDQWQALFDPSGAESRAEWFIQAAPSLLGPCTADAAKSLQVDAEAFRECFTWLFDFAYPSSSGEDRQASLMDRVSGTEGNERSWKARFRVLARLASGVRPILWVTDALESLVNDPETACRFPALLAEARACVPRSLTLLATNEDLWDSLFCRHVPEATRDRLSEVVLPMPALTLPEAEALIRARLRDLDPADAAHLTRFFAVLDLKGLASRGPLFPRRVLRHAGGVWTEARSSVFDAAAVSPSIATASPSPSPSTARARDQLHALAEAIRLQGLPTATSWERTPEEPVPAASIAAPAMPTASADQAPAAAEVPASLPRQFQELRLRHLRTAAQGRLGGLDLPRLHRFIALIGQRFPSIRQRVLEVGPGEEGKAVLWTLHNREMIFGFAPMAAESFWSRLLTAAWQDRESATRPRPFKIICFLPEGSSGVPASPEGWTGHPQARTTPLDRVIIDPELGASLLAAVDLIRSLPGAGAGAQERAVYGFLARELDFFWRRLTRPVPEWQRTEAGTRSPALATSET